MAEQHQSHEVQNLSLEESADRIAQLPGGLLAFDEPEAETAPKKEDAPAEHQENSPSEQDGKDPGEAEEEDPKKDEDAKPEDEEEPEDGKEPASEDDDPVYEVSMPNGETREVALSDLAAAYTGMGELETQQAEAAQVRRDYERRMSEIPSQVAQQSRAREEELARTIEQWVQLNPLPEPPSLEWLDPNHPDYNPDRYHYQKAEREALQAKYAQAGETLRGIAEQRQKEQRAYQQQEFEKLKSDWPELVTDDGKRAQVFRQAETHYGLSAQDLNAITDHKAFKVLRDALAYRAMKAEAPKVREKVRARPKVVKPGNRKSDSDLRKGDVSDARKRLKQSGRVDDAAAILERVIL